MVFKLYKPEKIENKEYSAEEIYNTLPIYSRKDKVLICDADILCYKIASVTEFKYLYTSSQGEEYKVKSKKSFKAYCEDNNLEIDSFTVTNT